MMSPMPLRGPLAAATLASTTDGNLIDIVDRFANLIAAARYINVALAPWRGKSFFEYSRLKHFIDAVSAFEFG